MDFEFLFRRLPEWRTIAQGVLFQPGDLVENAEIAEAAGEGDSPSAGSGSSDGSLGLGSLQEASA